MLTSLELDRGLEPLPGVSPWSLGSWEYQWGPFTFRLDGDESTNMGGVLRGSGYQVTYLGRIYLPGSPVSFFETRRVSHLKGEQESLRWGTLLIMLDFVKNLDFIALYEVVSFLQSLPTDSAGKSALERVAEEDLVYI